MKRIDGRTFDQLRPVTITPGFQNYPEGSALIEVGETRVICAVSIEDRVPAFLRNSGSGWLTAEYAMLPRATATRTRRDSDRGQVSGRSHEIQRLIGRALRSVTDLAALGERTLTIDCDVLQADGGTRTAAITGAYVAVRMAVNNLLNMGVINRNPLRYPVAATSIGIVHDNLMLDLCYDEDSQAAVDFNVVMTGKGDFVEIQGTAEGKPFNRQAVDDMLNLAEKGIRQLFEVQQNALK